MTAINQISRTVDWMYAGDVSTITRVSNTSGYVYYFLFGAIDSRTNDAAHVVSYLGDPVLPVFYLKSNVAITSGTGTSADPYRVEIA